MNLYRPGNEIVEITSKINSQIRKLKATRATNSGYCPGGLMLQWLYSENKNICKSEKEFGNLFNPMQFIFMTGIITDEFRKKHKVEYHHEALLRTLYLDFSNDEDDLVISTGFKRPFGNSYVEGDIADQMVQTSLIRGKEKYFPYHEQNEDEDEKTINDVLINREYVKFINILEAFAKNYEMKFTSFEGVKKNNEKFYLTAEERFNWTPYLQPEFGNHRFHSYLDAWQPSNPTRKVIIEKH